MFSIFPKDDYDQTLRIKRFLMAFGAYLIGGALCFVGYAMGVTIATLDIVAF